LKIRFNYRNIKFRIRKSRQHKIWISDVINGEGRIADIVNFIFTTDEAVKEINIEFLQHDYYTDVIAFDYCEGKRVRGEIYISVERVRENSEKFGVLFADEIRRVMVHSLLHLCGYGDAGNDEVKMMKEREDFWLSQWENGPYL